MYVILCLQNNVYVEDWSKIYKGAPILRLAHGDDKGIQLNQNGSSMLSENLEIWFLPFRLV